jgi:hypothetical protein
MATMDKPTLIDSNLGQAAPERIEEAEEIADAEAADMKALVAELDGAGELLATAFNRLVRSTEPSLCVAQGRVETAMETLGAAVDLVKGLLP